MEWLSQVHKLICISLSYLNVSLSLSQIFKIINMPNIWKRENQLMALDKKIEDTQFGSRLYTFLDWVITEKGIWIKRMNFWNKTASPQIPDVFGMPTGHVRYARVNKTKRTPLALDLFVSFPSSYIHPTISHRLPLAISWFHQEKKRGRLDWRRLASRLKAPGLGF